MTAGYFNFIITVKNTGQVTYDAYVGLSAWNGAQQVPGFWAKRPSLTPGQSDTITLPVGQIPGGTPGWPPEGGIINWISGSHNYLVRLYSKATEPAQASASGNWIIYYPATGAPDTSAIVAEKTGTVIST